MNTLPIKHRRAAVTLLELILALGLSTVVLAIIGMALNMYWRMFDQRRTTLEEARIARSVLRKVSDDLRSAIQFQPPDLSGLNIVSASMQGQMSDAAGALGALGSVSLNGANAGAGGSQLGGNPAGQATQTGAANQAASLGANTGGNNQQNAANGAGGANAAAGAGRAGGTSGGTSGSSNITASGANGMSSADGAEQGPATSSQSSAQLGLRGTMYELQIDISRLPRIDEYTALNDPNNPLQTVDIPSDVKTISYFVVGSEQEGADLQVGLKPGEELTPIRGLFRRERSRALSSLEEPLQMDGVSRDNSQLLAEEVTAIEFSYFDGYEWFSDWDSASMGGLPKAIEIAIEVNMRPPEDSGSSDGLSLGASSTDSTEAEPNVYKLVVTLPADPPLELPTSDAAGVEGGDLGMGMDPLNGANGTNANGALQNGMLGQGGVGMGGQGMAGAGAGIGGGQLGQGPQGQGGPGRGGQGQNGQGPGGNNQGGRGGRGGANNNNPMDGNNGGNGGGRRGLGGRGGQGGGGRGGQGLGGQGLGGLGGGQGLGGRGGQGLGGLGGGGQGFGGARGGLGGGLGGGGLGGRR